MLLNFLKKEEANTRRIGKIQEFYSDLDVKNAQAEVLASKDLMRVNIELAEAQKGLATINEEDFQKRLAYIEQLKNKQRELIQIQQEDQAKEAALPTGEELLARRAEKNRFGIASGGGNINALKEERERIQKEIQELEKDLQGMQGQVAQNAAKSLQDLDKQLQDVDKSIDQHNQKWEQLTKNVTDTFVDGIMEGQKFEDVLKDLVKQLIKAIAKQMVFNAVKAAIPGGGFLGGLFGMANGGSFKVGGNGGTDSQLVAFRATPDETVTVSNPEQMRGGGGGGAVINMTVNVDARGSERGVSDDLNNRLPKLIQNQVRVSVQELQRRRLI